MARATPQQGNPDAVALAVAKEVQDTMALDTVIPFASRISGDHRSDSDMDLMVMANRNVLTAMAITRNADKAYFGAPRRDWMSTIRDRRL